MTNGSQIVKITDSNVIRYRSVKKVQTFLPHAVQLRLLGSIEKTQMSRICTSAFFYSHVQKRRAVLSAVGYQAAIENFSAAVIRHISDIRRVHLHNNTIE